MIFFYRKQALCHMEGHLHRRPAFHADLRRFGNVSPCGIVPIPVKVGLLPQATDICVLLPPIKHTANLRHALKCI